MFQCYLKCLQPLQLQKPIIYMAAYSLPAWLLSPVFHASSLSSPKFPLQDLALALIMLCVVLKRIHPDTEWSGKISGLQFSSTPGTQESARSQGVTSTILTVPRSHHGEAVNLEANGEPRTKPVDVEAGMGEINEENTRI
jgi:hypothetical protein